MTILDHQHKFSETKSQTQIGTTGKTTKMILRLQPRKEETCLQTNPVKAQQLKQAEKWKSTKLGKLSKKPPSPEQVMVRLVKVIKKSNQGGWAPLCQGAPSPSPSPLPSPSPSSASMPGFLFFRFMHF